MSYYRSPPSFEVSGDTPPVKPEEVQSPKPAPPPAGKEDLRAMARKQLTRVLQARYVCVCMWVGACVGERVLCACGLVCVFSVLEWVFIYWCTCRVTVLAYLHVCGACAKVYSNPT